MARFVVLGECQSLPQRGDFLTQLRLLGEAFRQEPVRDRLGVLRHAAQLAQRFVQRGRVAIEPSRGGGEVGQLGRTASEVHDKLRTRRQTEQQLLVSVEDGSLHDATKSIVTDPASQQTDRLDQAAVFVQD